MGVEVCRCGSLASAVLLHLLLHSNLVALPGFACEKAVEIGEHKMFQGRLSGLTKSMGTKSKGRSVASRFHNS